MQDVVLVSGEEIVHANDLAAHVQESFAQVRTEETRAAGNQYAIFRHVAKLQQDERAINRVENPLLFPRCRFKRNDKPASGGHVPHDIQEVEAV
ncbi:hypothetical protein [Desulfovibrio sp. Huiquan2017]|uniref:hypothetical protein n=1 Tax=Desulfovibrio sp. Huiquan2017 TaxID=2816861 RepID=UPI00336A1BA3